MMVVTFRITIFLMILLCREATEIAVKNKAADEAHQWDEEMTFHLHRFYETADMQQINCKDKNPRNASSKLSLKDLNSKELTRAMRPSYEFFGVVTDEKKRATAHLTKAALSLPSGGDIVETGDNALSSVPTTLPLPSYSPIGP